MVEHSVSRLTQMTNMNVKYKIYATREIVCGLLHIWEESIEIYVAKWATGAGFWDSNNYEERCLVPFKRPFWGFKKPIEGSIYGSLWQMISSKKALYWVDQIILIFEMNNIHFNKQLNLSRARQNRFFHARRRSASGAIVPWSSVRLHRVLYIRKPMGNSLISWTHLWLWLWKWKSGSKTKLLVPWYDFKYFINEYAVPDCFRLS